MFEIEFNWCIISSPPVQTFKILSRIVKFRWCFENTNFSYRPYPKKDKLQIKLEVMMYCIVYEISVDLATVCVR